MVITVNLYYTGINGTARKFVEEMLSSGTVQKKSTVVAGVCSLYHLIKSLLSNRK